MTFMGPWPKNNYLTFRSKVKVQRRSLRHATHHLMVMHPHTKYHWPISKETIIWPRGQNVKVQTKVFMVRDTPLMVMHPHTKYHWPISKDKKCYGPNKKILFKKQLFVLEVKGQDPTKVIMVCNTSPYGHAPTYQISLTLFYCNIEMCHIPANINLR
jgi:hypothetical protein